MITEHEEEKFRDAWKKAAEKLQPDRKKAKQSWLWRPSYAPIDRESGRGLTFKNRGGQKTNDDEG